MKIDSQLYVGYQNNSQPHKSRMGRGSSPLCNFKGVNGDEFVKQIVNLGYNQKVDVDLIVEKMRGVFGFKKGLIRDYMESLVNAVVERSKNDRTNDNLNAIEIRKLRTRCQNLKASKIELEEDYKAQIATLEAEHAKEVEALQNQVEQLNKYKEMANVKPVLEAGVTKENIVKAIKEMVDNRVVARKSMVDYLLTGKGQEEALKQIERRNLVQKAEEYGLDKIPEISQNFNKNFDNKILHRGTGTDFVIDDLIYNGLLGVDEAAILSYPKSFDAIKNNALVLLKSMCKNDNEFKKVELSLSQTLKNIEEYRTCINSFVISLKKANEIKSYELDFKECCPNEWKCEVTYNNGDTRTWDFSEMLFAGSGS